MKNVILVSVLAATLLPANAQLFSRESLGGAAFGGVAGGIIGHNSGRRTAEGVAIGAGAGLLLGAITHNARRDYYRDYYYDAPTPYIAGPGYYYTPVRPNYAVTGTVLGGVAGGIIGHNSGRRTGAGIAIGAGTGLLLGALAEQNARRPVPYLEPAPTYVVSQPQPSPEAEVVAAPPATPPQQVSVIHKYPGSPSPMSSANSLFGR